MTPAQVAAQAGNLDEFKAITTDHNFQPEKMGGVQYFFNICRDQSEKHYQEMMKYYKEVFLKKFTFDDKLGAFISIV